MFHSPFEYLPAAQSMQVDCPLASAYLPAVHLVQAEAPVNELYVPAMQSMQVLAPVAAETEEQGQSLQ